MRPGRRPSRGTLAIAVTAFVCTFVSVAPASAAPAQIAASNKCCSFIAPVFEQPRGEVANFVNPLTADAPHNVEATGLGPDGLPLFYSQTIRVGEQSAVAGTQYLGAGVYPFVCSLHRETMRGSLQVTDSATAVKRPSVRLAIPARQLRSAIRKRIFRVTVDSPTGVSRGSLRVRIGGKAVGLPVRLDLPAKGRLQAKVSIPSRTVRTLERKRSVILKAEARVPFGSPAIATREIR